MVTIPAAQPPRTHGFPRTDSSIGLKSFGNAIPIHGGDVLHAHSRPSNTEPGRSLAQGARTRTLGVEQTHSADTGQVAVQAFAVPKSDQVPF